MKTFAESSKNKNKKKNAQENSNQSGMKPTKPSVLADSENEISPSKSPSSAASQSAREKLLDKFGKKPKKVEKNDSEEEKKEEDAFKQKSKKELRRWVTISDKVDKKLMDSVVVNKDDKSAHEVNLEAEMEKYLGGDDEVLKGFYDSDEEVEFDSIGLGTTSAAGSNSN